MLKLLSLAVAIACVAIVVEGLPRRRFSLENANGGGNSRPRPPRGPFGRLRSGEPQDPVQIIFGERQPADPNDPNIKSIAEFIIDQAIEEEKIVPTSFGSGEVVVVKAETQQARDAIGSTALSSQIHHVTARLIKEDFMGNNNQEPGSEPKVYTCAAVVNQAALTDSLTIIQGPECLGKYGDDRPEVPVEFPTPAPTQPPMTTPAPRPDGYEPVEDLTNSRIVRLGTFILDRAHRLYLIEPQTRHIAPYNVVVKEAKVKVIVVDEVGEATILGKKYKIRAELMDEEEDGSRPIYHACRAKVYVPEDATQIRHVELRTVPECVTYTKDGEGSNSGPIDQGSPIGREGVVDGSDDNSTETSQGCFNIGESTSDEEELDIKQIPCPGESPATDPVGSVPSDPNNPSTGGVGKYSPRRRSPRKQSQGSSGIDLIGVDPVYDPRTGRFIRPAIPRPLGGRRRSPSETGTSGGTNSSSSSGIDFVNVDPAYDPNTGRFVYPKIRPPPSRRSPSETGTSGTSNSSGIGFLDVDPVYDPRTGRFIRPALPRPLGRRSPSEAGTSGGTNSSGIDFVNVDPAYDPNTGRFVYPKIRPPPSRRSPSETGTGTATGEQGGDNQGPSIDFIDVDPAYDPQTGQMVWPSDRRPQGQPSTSPRTPSRKIFPSVRRPLSRPLLG